MIEYLIVGILAFCLIKRGFPQLPLNIHDLDAKPEAKNPPGINLGPRDKFSPYNKHSSIDPGMHPGKVSSSDYKYHVPNDIFG